MSQTPSSKGLNVSVIVPVGEHHMPLDAIYREFAPPVRAHGGSFEFIFVVPPWKTDLSASLEDLRESGEPIRVLEVGSGVGEHGMLEAALRNARGRTCLTLPAYPRVEGEALGALLDAVDQGADLANARRTSDRNPFVNRVQKAAFHALLGIGVRSSIEDVGSGVRALRREVLDSVPLHGDLLRFLPVLAEREGFDVVEVPVAQHSADVRTRVYSPGVYLRRLVDILGLTFLMRFTRKPLRFFGLIGAVTSTVGAIILVVLFFERLQGTGIADRPVLLLGVLLFALGVQAIGIGLIGEIIVHLNTDGSRREYRLRDVSDTNENPRIES